VGNGRGCRWSARAVGDAKQSRSATGALRLPVSPLRVQSAPSPACDSRSVGETKIYRVALTSKDPPHDIDHFYKHVGERLPDEGEIINVVRFLRGRVIRARVTRVDPNYNPQIAATEVS
jgi:hypothetical protein